MKKKLIRQKILEYLANHPALQQNGIKDIYFEMKNIVNNQEEPSVQVRPQSSENLTADDIVKVRNGA